MYNRPVTVHFVRRHSFLDGQSTFCDRPLFATIYLRNRPLFATVHFSQLSTLGRKVYFDKTVQINRRTNMMSERQSNKSELPWIEYQNENGRFRKPCIIEII